MAASGGHAAADTGAASLQFGSTDDPPMLTQEELNFVVTPPRIVFRGYEPFRTYETPLKFKNQTKTVQSVRVIAPESRFFSVSEPRGGSSTLRVARGLTVSYTVSFRPEEDCDYDCDLVVKTDTERFVVEVRALASRGRLDLPKLYSFPSTPVKHRDERAVFVRNVGAKPAQWSITATPPWTVEPDVGFLDPGAPPMQLSLAFHPTVRQTHVGTLLVSYSNGDTARVRLEGNAVDVPVQLSTNSIALAPTFISLERQETVTLFNRSDVTVAFQWKAHETEEEERAHKSSLISTLQERHRDAASVLQQSGPPPKRGERRRTSAVVAQARDLKSLARAAQSRRTFIETTAIAFEHMYFTIEPLSGQIPAKSHRHFTVTFNPQMATTCEVVAYVDVVGRAERLPLSLKGHGIGPQCQFSYDALDLGDVFINSIHHYEVILENRGSIEARYSLQQSRSLFAPKFRFSPSHAAIPPGQTQVIEIEFCSDIIGILNEAFHFTIQGAKDDLVLHFKGRVIGPTFHCDVDEIDFGNVAYNFMHRRTFNLVNTSEIPMRFRLRVPEDAQSAEREFDITPAQGLVLPHGKKSITLDFLSNTVHEYNAHLVVDIDDVGDNLYSVPVKATCIVPEITVTCDALDFGKGSPCFVGHPYTMEIEVKNDTQLSCKYDVGLPADDDPVRRKVNITVDQKKGIVNQRSTHQIALTLTAKMVGSVHLPIYIRILGSEKRIPVSLSARIQGPVVQIDHGNLDFGRVNVLEEHCRKVELNNTSPIPAMFSTRLVNRSPIFSLKTAEGTIAKHSKCELPVCACLDDTMRFTEELVITIANSRELVVKLSAIGTGTTLVPSIPLNKDLDFGNVFTTTVVHRAFIIHNKGRRVQQIGWSNERPKPKEGEPPFTFTIQPERATIPGKGEQEFVIEGSSARAGKAAERFICKLTKTHKQVFKLSTVGSFVVPLLEPSDKSLQFAYSWEPGHKDDGEHMQQSRPLTLRNVSPLTLEFSLKAGAPFTIDKTDYVLKEHESCTVYVEFDAGYRKDRVSHKLKTKLSIAYKEHPQRESIDLIADVHFPNVSLEHAPAAAGDAPPHPAQQQQQQSDKPEKPGRPTVDFGCVMHETERRAFMTIMNTSKVAAKYSWVFEDAPEHGRPATEQRDKRPLTAVGAAAGAFDVLPIRGFLRPGEAERVEFVFYAQSAVRARCLGILLVEGGPEYPVLLQGEANTVHFRLDKSALDFGALQYDRREEKEVFLHNLGKVSFTYQVDLSGLRRGGVVDVVPMQGQVKAGDRARMQVRFCPQVPDLVDDCFQVQVAHYEPHSINVRGLGLYPNVNIHGSGVTRMKPPDYERFEAVAQSLLSEDSRHYFLRAGGATALPVPGGRRHDDSHVREALMASVDSEVERLYFTHLIQSEAAGDASIRRGSVAPDALSTPGAEAAMPISPNSTAVQPDPYSLTPRKMPGGELKHVVACYKVDFGAVVKGETRRKTLRVANISQGPLTIQVDKRSLANSGIQISPEKPSKIMGHPTYGELAVDVQLITKGDAARDINFGDYTLTVPIDIRGGPVVTLEVRAFIMVPQLTVLPGADTVLDFDTDPTNPDSGLRPFTTVGEARIIQRQFYNPLPLPCEWVARSDGKRGARNRFLCRPDRGVLAPEERCDVQVHFVPIDGDITQGAINVKVAQNPHPLQLTCKGTGEAIAISLDAPHIELGPVFPFVAQDREVTVRNESRVPIEVFSYNFDANHLIEDEVLRNIDHLYDADGTILLPPREKLPYYLPDHLLDAYWHHLSSEDDQLAAAMDVPNAAAADTERATPSRHGSVTGMEQSASDEAAGAGNVVLVWGPPLSGKTSVAEQISERYGLRIVTLDEVLRWVVELDCDEGAHLRSVLAPVEGAEREEISPAVLAEAIASRLQEEDCKNGAVFDGCGSAVLERAAGWDRADVLAKAVCAAAVQLRMGFSLVVLDIDEGLIELRKAVQLERAAQKALAAAEVSEVPEDEYDAMEAGARRAHERALTKLRRCKKEARIATERRARLERERAQQMEQHAPESLLAALAREEEARLAAEAEEAAKKKPGGKKGKEQAAEVDEPKFDAALTPTQRWKRAHPFLMRALDMVEKEDAETAKRPVLLPQSGPQEGRSREESMADQFAMLSGASGLPFPPKADPEGQHDSGELAVNPPQTKARIERPKQAAQRTRPKCLQILTKQPAKKKETEPAKPPPKGKGGAMTPTPPGEGEGEPELVNTVTRWQLKPKGEPGSEQTLFVRFESINTAPAGIEETLEFGVVGSQLSWPLTCKGICGYPEITRDMKTCFTRKRMVRRAKNGVVSFDFGPLLVHEPGGQGGAKQAAPKKSVSSSSPSGPTPPDQNCEWITIENQNLFQAEIVWTFSDENQKTFTVHPQVMTLEKGETAKLKLLCLPDQSGEHEHTLIGLLKDNPAPVQFPLYCTGWRPQVDVEGAQDGVCTLNFGKLLLDVSKADTVAMRNVSQIPLRWELVDSTEPTKRLRQEFKLEPARGTLGSPASAADRKETVIAYGRLEPRVQEGRSRAAQQPAYGDKRSAEERLPKDRDVISVTFEAGMADIMTCDLSLQIRDDDPNGKVWQTVKVALVAEAYNIYAEALERVVMGQNGLVRVGMEHKTELQLLNKGKYPFGYEFNLPARFTRGAAPLFRCTPMKGELGPRDPLKVEVCFDPKNEISCRGESTAEFEIMIYKGKDELCPGEDPMMVVGSLPVRVEVEARYNRYTIRPPERKLDFGPCLFNDKKKMTFDVTNTGPFEIRYRLYDQTAHKDGPPEAGGTPEPDAAAAKGKAAKPAKPAKGAAPPAAAAALQIGAFKIDPAEGAIAPGESAEVTVVLDPAGFPAQPFHEKLGINIEDCDPSEVGAALTLDGESCVPGIAADLAAPGSSAVFEEQQVVPRLAFISKQRAAFARDDRVFTFGAVILSRLVQENFRISNPFKVPCTVTVAIQAKGGAAAPPAAGGRPDPAAQAAAAQAAAAAAAFDVTWAPLPSAEPSDAKVLTADIPPGGHRYATVSFKPTEQRQYSASFCAQVADGTEPTTRELIFELRGDGALPRVKIGIPPPPTPPVAAEPAAPPDPKAGGKKGRPGSAGKGKGAAAEPPPAVAPNTLLLPRTVIGTKCDRELTVTNVGDLPAEVKLQTRDMSQAANAFTIPGRGQELVLAPGAKEVWGVQFAPQHAREYEAKLAITVADNPAEETVVTVAGEGVDELVTFDGIGDCENLVIIDDCGLGQTARKPFRMKSHCGNVLRFKWQPPKMPDGTLDERFKVSPGVGWLLPNSEKECTVSFTSETTEDFSRKGLQLSLWQIRSHAKRAPDWDDRLTAVRWEPDLTPPPSPQDPPAGGTPDPEKEAPEEGPDAEAARAEQAAAQRQKELERRRRPLRRRVETLPEPPHEVLPSASEGDSAHGQKTLFCKGACGWAKYELSPVEDGRPLQEAGVRFAKTALMQTRTVAFTLKNTGEIALECQWLVLKPSGEPLGEEEIGRFRVEPPVCTVPVEQSVQCKVLYSPLDTEQHVALLRGCIPNVKPVPDPANPDAPGVAPQPQIKLEGRAECPLAHFELAESDYLSADRRDPALPGPGGEPIDKSTRVIEFAAPGVRVRTTKRFYILNPTSMSYDFEWEDVTGNPQVSKLFSCRTMRGVVHAMKKSEIVFEFTPDSLDVRETFWNLRIGGSGYFKPLSMPFLVVGHATEPNVFFSQTRLNFDQVVVGVRAKRTIQIENHEAGPYSFAFERPGPGSAVTVAPVSGRVQAESTREIEVTFLPQSEEPLNHNLVCNVKRKTTPLTCNVKGVGCTVDGSPKPAGAAKEERPPTKDGGKGK
eukprot:TRINITY_DN7388_c0_g1_i1.p1 TRINITY_DN7388_c0_g1~~TRINITY_DN7388_c0_g1_i1.p1  ORF type:complete len:3850 (+),score=1433.28 TRINITY_DN7388_c0_g1_i1:116-11551(+)